jgi:hypothetical protein
VTSKTIRGAASACLAAALVAALCSCSSHSAKPRGAATAQEAAETFAIAINAGSGSAAAAISCTTFSNDAHQAATSGADPGISYSVSSVAVTGTDATAQLDEKLDVSGQTRTMDYTLTLTKKSGLWLVCGRR